MREIKFRGKRVENCEWVYGGLAIYGEHAFIVRAELQISELDNVYFSTTGIEIYHATVGQYTGLKDKNGKDIYEGDICKNGGGMIGEIVFNEFAWMFRWKSGNYYPFGQWCEVIGNIYENPELLVKT